MQHAPAHSIKRNMLRLPKRYRLLRVLALHGRLCKRCRPLGWELGILLTLSMVLPSCGYHLAGPGAFPGDVNRIFVPVLNDRTGEIGIEATFTNDLIYEFSRRGDALAPTREQADAVLLGEVTSIGVKSVSRRDILTSEERRVTVSLDLWLRSKAGKLIWAGRNLSDSEAYSIVEDNKLATQANRREAIGIISKRIAERVYSRLTERF